MNQLDEAVLLREICRHLDASIARLPLATKQRLDETRQAALLQKLQFDPNSAEGLASAVRRELDDSNSLAPDIEARLDQIRLSAVAKFEQQQSKAIESRGFSLSAWLKSQADSFKFAAHRGMLATACVMLTAITLFYVDSRPAGTLTLEEEIGLIATAEDIELYENLEFYLWLADNESLTL